MKTRQAILVEPERFEIETSDVTPASDELLVKMSACGLCNWELNHWSGKLGNPRITLGHEGCGSVVEVGKDVTRLKEGDKVTGLPDSQHCFADYFLLKEQGTMLINTAPEPHISLGEPIICVQNVVRAARPQVGDIVVVLGCGPMGLWCIQNLSGSIPGELVSVDVDASRREMALAFGATDGIAPDEGDPYETFKTCTGGRMADIVIEGTGNPKGLALAIDLLAAGGHLVVMSSFKEPEKVDVVTCCSKHIRVDFAHPGIFPDIADCLRRAEGSICRGVFSFGKVISHSFKLEEIQTAFETLADKPAGYLKGIVTP